MSISPSVNESKRVRHLSLARFPLLVVFLIALVLVLRVPVISDGQPQAQTVSFQRRYDKLKRTSPSPPIPDEPMQKGTPPDVNLELPSTEVTSIHVPSRDASATEVSTAETPTPRKLSSNEEILREILDSGTFDQDSPDPSASANNHDGSVQRSKSSQPAAESSRVDANVAKSGEDRSVAANRHPDRRPPENGQAVSNLVSQIGKEWFGDSPKSDEPEAARMLRLRNPSVNRIAVRFVINRKAHQLEPGEYVEFADQDAWSILYHRGGDFGNSRKELVPGTYSFSVTERGWTLGSSRTPLAREQRK